MDCIYGLYMWSMWSMWSTWTINIWHPCTWAWSPLRCGPQAKLCARSRWYTLSGHRKCCHGCNKTTGPDQSRPQKMSICSGTAPSFAASLSVVSLIHSDDNGMPSFLRAPGDIIQTRLRLCPAQLAVCPVARPGPMRHGGNGKSPWISWCLLIGNV